MGRARPQPTEPQPTEPQPTELQPTELQPAEAQVGPPAGPAPGEAPPPAVPPAEPSLAGPALAGPTAAQAGPPLAGTSPDGALPAEQQPVRVQLVKAPAPFRFWPDIRGRWDLFDFLNSGFFITLIVGGVIGFWQWRAAVNEKEAERKDRREKIAAEIYFRIGRSELFATDGKDAQKRLDGDTGNSLSWEFRQVPLSGLFLQLIPLCDSEETKEIKEQLRALIQSYNSLAPNSDITAYRSFQQRARSVISPLLPKGV